MIKKLWHKALALVGAVPKVQLLDERAKHDRAKAIAEAESKRAWREVQNTHLSCEHIRQVTTHRDEERFIHRISFEISQETLKECLHTHGQTEFIQGLSRHIASRLVQQIQQEAGR